MEQQTTIQSSVFITGGTSGMGLALARLYYRNGWRVGVCGRNLEKLSEVDRQNFSAYHVDVLDIHKLEEAITSFSKEGPDLLIAAAGKAIPDKKNIPDFNLAREVLNINIFGVVNAFDVALKFMLPKKKGHLVAIGSVSGLVGLPGNAAYCASKASVNIFCESLAIDLISHGINVTAILPGFVDTPLTQANSHPMPFLQSVDRAALKIKWAIDQKKVLYVFPWQMRLVMYILDKVPRRTYRSIMKIVARLGRNWKKK